MDVELRVVVLDPRPELLVGEDGIDVDLDPLLLEDVRPARYAIFVARVPWPERGEVEDAPGVAFRRTPPPSPPSLEPGVRDDRGQAEEDPRGADHQRLGDRGGCTARTRSSAPESPRTVTRVCTADCGNDGRSPTSRTCRTPSLRSSSACPWRWLPFGNA